MVKSENLKLFYFFDFYLGTKSQKLNTQKKQLQTAKLNLYLISPTLDPKSTTLGSNKLKTFLIYTFIMFDKYFLTAVLLSKNQSYFEKILPKHYLKFDLTLKSIFVPCQFVPYILDTDYTHDL